MKVVIFILLLVALVALADWTNPTGVPTPTIGITNNHWVYTNSEYKYDYGSGDEAYRSTNDGPYTHWIDNTHGSATDTTNDFGTPDVPRLTWPAEVSPGSVVQVRGGPYDFNNEAAKMNFRSYATQTNVSFIRGQSTNNYAYLSDTLQFGGHWVIAENLMFTNNAGTDISVRPALWSTNLHDIAIRYCLSAGTGSEAGSGGKVAVGTITTNSTLYWTSNFVGYSCVATNYGDYASTNESDWLMYSISANNVYYSYILNNTAWYGGGDGIRIGKASGQFNSSNCWIAANLFHTMGENAVDIKQFTNAVVSDNIFHSFDGHKTSDPGQAIVMHDGNANIWVVNNIVSNSVYGIGSTDLDTESYWIGNQITDCTIGLYPDRGGGTFYIVNNTVEGCSNSVYASGTVTAIHFVNNILSDNNGSYNLYVNDSAVASASTVSNCMIWDETQLNIGWGGTDYTTVASFISGEGTGQNSTENQPTYVDASTANYRLDTGSDGIDEGLDVSTYSQTYSNIFGPELTNDYYGVTKPVAGVFEIGAFEFNGLYSNLVKSSRSHGGKRGQRGAFR